MGTIVVLFALQGDAITSQPWNVVRIALPRPCCFAIMFAPDVQLPSRPAGLRQIRHCGVHRGGQQLRAVAIGTFGVTSGQALAGVVGPLIEVPVLVALVYVSVWLGPRVFPCDPTVPAR